MAEFLDRGRVLSEIEGLLQVHLDGYFYNQKRAEPLALALYKVRNLPFETLDMVLHNNADEVIVLNKGVKGE